MCLPATQAFLRTTEAQLIIAGVAYCQFLKQAAPFQHGQKHAPDTLDETTHAIFLDYATANDRRQAQQASWRGSS